LASHKVWSFKLGIGIVGAYGLLKVTLIVWTVFVKLKAVPFANAVETARFLLKINEESHSWTEIILSNFYHVVSCRFGMVWRASIASCQLMKHFFAILFSLSTPMSW